MLSHHRSRLLAGGDVATTYLFNATAADAADQTFLNNQLLDTVAEGMLAGSMTGISVGSVDPASRLAIVGGRFRILGDDSWTETGFIGTADLPDAVGRVWKTRADIYTLSTPFAMSGYRDSASVNIMQESIWGAALTRITYQNGAQVTVGAFPSAGTYDLALVSKGSRTGFKYLIKKVGEPTWDHFATSSASVSSFFPAVSGFRGSHFVDFMRVTETLFPDMISGTDYSALDLI